MVDYDTANARLTALATFMGGLSFIGLILSVNVLFLLTSIVLFLTSAVTLASAYFESGVPKDIGLRRARRMNVSGTILTFWAISALLLVAFGFTSQAILYAVVAILAPIAFVIARRVQRVPL